MTDDPETIHAVGIKPNQYDPIHKHFIDTIVNEMFLMERHAIGPQCYWVTCGPDIKVDRIASAIGFSTGRK